jgi:hypothetical protein
VLSVTEPTETAVAAAVAHTAVLAGRPGNAEPLAEAGRLFGRVAHLLDAVEDLEADRESGAWNPVTATATPLPEVRRLCDDAVRGIALALADAEFTDDRLVKALLVGELEHAIHRIFAHAAPGYDPAPWPESRRQRRKRKRAERRARRQQRRSDKSDCCDCCDCCGCDC